MSLRSVALAIAIIAIGIAAFVSYDSGSWMPLVMAGSIALVVIAGTAWRPKS